MATVNPFNLLVDDDAEDPSQLIAAAQKVAAVSQAKSKGVAPAKGAAPAAQDKPSAKLPSKPVPQAEARKKAKRRPPVKKKKKACHVAETCPPRQPNEGPTRPVIVA